MNRDINRIDRITTKRVWWTFVLFAVAALAVVGRLAKLQIAEHDYYETRVLNQLTRDTTINPARGNITDRGGNIYQIEIPGVSDANAILEELGQPGNLYFIAQTDANGNENYTYSSGFHQDEGCGWRLHLGGRHTATVLRLTNQLLHLRPRC